MSRGDINNMSSLNMCELLYLQPQNLSEGERDLDGCGVGCDVRRGGWGGGRGAAVFSLRSNISAVSREAPPESGLTRIPEGRAGHLDLI